ncbi:alkylhydroperoxide reductase/thiol protein [Haloferula helveola]|uniref:Alkylhydroperoxide reductase/thiol protein n=1 Tax=Haloferula helveola TaxID=490095 RepID=A0ABN6HC60_9BACT|nr:alkylhydroperoxide reductase/thiol protein [Haloferula helveola]
MKTYPILAFLFASSLAVSAETWTSADGRTANMTLVEVVEEGGEKVGVFRLNNGKTARLKASQLSDESAERLGEWVDPNAPKSVFDETLEGNLLRLDGDKLAPCEDATKPTKYYLFYYTASWCGPCQRFTPSLVQFYDEKKSDEFEIILVTSDRDEASMTKYATSKKMAWPHLKLSKVGSFRSKFKHPGGGIPNLVLTDLEGNIIKSSYEGKNYMGPTVVMQHLGSLLK